MSRIYTSAEQLIGHTPLLELSRIERGEQLEARILAKIESMNPGGSVKDRVASVGAARGYRVIIVMPETMSLERRLPSISSICSETLSSVLLQ